MRLIKFHDTTVDVDDILYVAPHDTFSDCLVVAFKSSDRKVRLSVQGSKEFQEWASGISAQEIGAWH